MQEGGVSDVRPTRAHIRGVTVAIVDDRALVAALVAGDPRGLEGAYRTYSDRLYTYCRGLLRDPDAASDAVHDTFVIAGQRAGQLREPDRLRAWLYAIARNECLRTLRTRARHVPLEEAGDVSAPPTDPGRGPQADQVRELVWAAAQALNPGDRQVFELMVRHGLSAADVAGVLGVSADHAHARLSRARAQLERSLGALLVARTGAGECGELAGLLRGWDGELTALMRKRIARHIESCATCAARQDEQLRPANLLSAYAALPLLAAPAGLWPRLRLTSADPGLRAAREAIGRRAGRFDPATGFPRPLDAAVRRVRRLAATAAAAVLLLLVLGGTVVFAGLRDEPAAELLAPTPGHTPASTPQEMRTGSPEPSLAAPSAAPTRSPSRGPNRVPTRTPSRSLTTSTPSVPEPPPPAPLSIGADGRIVCNRMPTLEVVVHAEGGRLKAAELYWAIRTTEHEPMAVSSDGSTASGRESFLAAIAQVTWWVEVVATDGRTTRTPPVTLANTCVVPS
jgi:RNA polymerase sigma factor (sigma-70 family)